MNTNNGTSNNNIPAPSSPTSEKPCEPMIYSSSATPDIVDSATNGGHNNNKSHLYRQRSEDGFSSPRPDEMDSLEMSRDNQMSLGRQSPEGKDNMIVVPREQNGGSKGSTTDQYSTAADSNNNNGKINVQVTVLFGELITFGGKTLFGYILKTIVVIVATNSFLF